MHGIGTEEDGDESGHLRDARLVPLGRALRATFDADNHATLSKDVTALMLDLSQVPFEPHEMQPLPVPRLVPPRLHWLARMRLAMRRLR